MIKFYGLISEDNKKVIIKKEKKILFFASMIPVFLGSCLTIIASIKIDLIYLLFLIPLLFFLCIPFFPLSKRTMDLMIPFEVSICNETIISQGNNFKSSKKISDIKKIVDYGSYYFIYFKWPKKSYRFLCQKNLISEDKLITFENLFKNKLSKKGKDNI